MVAFIVDSHSIKSTTLTHWSWWSGIGCAMHAIDANRNTLMHLLRPHNYHITAASQDHCDLFQFRPIICHSACVPNGPSVHPLYGCCITLKLQHPSIRILFKSIQDNSQTRLIELYVNQSQGNYHLFSNDHYRSIIILLIIITNNFN